MSYEHLDNVMDLSLGERLNASFKIGTELACKAANNAVNDWGGKVADIDNVIVVTSTCLMSPSIDAHIIKNLGLRINTVSKCIGMTDAYANCKSFNHTVLLVCVDV
jgi:predicted naringenin-chalcone synthase